MANKKIRLRIVTPMRQLYDKETEMVIMRTSSGDLGVLADHQPLTATLDYGILRIIDGDSELRATVFGGFVNVKPDCITVLSDASEWPEEIDVNRVQEAKERAEDYLKKSDSDVARAELALRRALVRIEASSYKSKSS